jgi:hypothetical protein
MSELNPLLMQELNRLRIENKDLMTKIDKSSLQSLEALNKELSDQKCVSTSLQKKYMTTKDTLEKAFRDHARKSQDDSVYSKWSSLKTKAESSADRFLTDVVSLIESISMMSQMQSTLQGQLPEPMSNSELPVAPKPIGEKRVR